MRGGVEAGLIVGRQPELARISRAVESATLGQGAIVLVAGEPGIGKTRLLTEASDAAQRAGARTVWGRCVIDGSPYWPWLQVLRSLEGERAAGMLDPRPGRVDDSARLRQFELVGDVLQAATVDAPGLLLLDDLQWADTPTLRLLGYLARDLRARRLAIVGAYRDVDVHSGHPLADVLAEMGAGLSVLSLRGLGPEGVAWLLREQLADVTDEISETVRAKTHGNPFYVREVARLLEERGGGTTAVPAAVGEMAKAQIAQCSGPCRDLISVAAVATTIDLELAAAVLQLEPADLLEPAEEAARRRILEPIDTRLRFRHDLLREAVLDLLPARRRAELHWTIGVLVEQQGRPERMDEAARHLQAGVAVGDPRRAAALAVTTARRAMSMLAFEVAVDHLDWALGVIHRDALRKVDVDEFALLLLLGEARLQSGSWERAGDAFADAASLARERGDAEGLGLAALGFGAGLSGFEVRMNDVRQIASLEEAATALGDTDSAVRAFVLARLSVALSFVDEPARRTELARHAREVAARVGDPAAQAHALAAWCDVIAGPEHSEERLASGAEIVRLGREAASDELELLGHRFRVVALLELGDIVEADRAIGAFERLIRRCRLPIARWYVPLWRGMQALLRGDLDTALRLAADAEAMGAAVDSTNAAMLGATLRFHVAIAQRSLPSDLGTSLREMVEEYVTYNPTGCSARTVLVAIALLEEDLDTVRTHLQAINAVDFGEVDAEWLEMMSIVVDACLALGDSATAERAGQQLLPFDGRVVVDGIGAAVVGSVSEYLGVCDVICGRRAQGAARLHAVAEQYQRMAAPLLERRALARAERGHGSGPAAPLRASLRREDSEWVIDFGGQECRVRDVKGLRDLAVLLERPGADVHVAQLVGGGVAAAPEVVIDDQAMAAYRGRVADLESDVADAEAAHDLERASRARAELDFIVDELARATGLGGRPRHIADEEEHARQAVRARIRYAIGRIRGEHPELARHLENSVRTGAFCVYAPERDVRWEVVT